MAVERLQKVIARAGLASRRGAETLILDGRVRVNGRVVTEMGTKVDPRKDKVDVDGKRIEAEDLVYVVLHKPRNVVSTLSDPEGRPTVAEHVERIGARLYPVGRLDFSTSGVLLMTNDGDFAQGLLHPRQKVPKTYVVKLDKEITPPELDRWREGIELEDGMTLPAQAHILRYENGKAWIQVTLTEGRNHQVRRMAAATGFVAMRLARTSFAEIDHEGLRPGMWRPLTVDELKKLKKAYGVPARVRPQPKLVEDKKKIDDREDKKRRRRVVRPKR
jgi:23S rRNA pseudouridine2605 synthase